MRKKVLTLLQGWIICTLTSYQVIAVVKTIKYLNYTNERYEFSIKYPNYFKATPPPENGDGLIFESGDGAVFTVYGANNIFDDTVKSLYATRLANIKSVAYKLKKGNSFVISWTANNHIFYEKTVLGVGSYNSFLLEYPKSLKTKYSPIIKEIQKSFKTPSLSECH